MSPHTCTHKYVVLKITDVLIVSLSTHLTVYMWYPTTLITSQEFCLLNLKKYLCKILHTTLYFLFYVFPHLLHTVKTRKFFGKIYIYIYTYTRMSKYTYIQIILIPFHCTFIRTVPNGTPSSLDTPVLFVYSLNSSFLFLSFPVLFSRILDNTRLTTGGVSGLQLQNWAVPEVLQ